jgi:hypothetical protein
MRVAHLPPDCPRTFLAGVIRGSFRASQFKLTPPIFGAFCRAGPPAARPGVFRFLLYKSTCVSASG